MTAFPDMGNYEAFLEGKAALPGGSGFEPIEVPDFLFPFQRHLTEWAIRRGRASIMAGCGLGKALRISEPVLTPDGWDAIGNLVEGDEVIGSDGLPHRVIGVYDQGIRELFKVRFTDGVEVICDGDHLWSVRTQQQRFRGSDGRTLTTRQIIDEGLADGLNRKRHFIPLVRPVQFSEAQLPIDPYTFGVLLGDGSFRGHGISFTTADPEILSYLRIPEGVEVRPKFDSSGRCPSYGLTVGKAGCGQGKTNPLTDKVKLLGLMDHLSCDKFIPEPYLRGSISQRRAILSGLLDADGSICDGTIEFVTTSPRLAEGVADLVQSLGGVAPIRTKQPYFAHKGEIKPGRLAYRINIKLPKGTNPFRLERKRAAWSDKARDEPPRAIASIEPFGSDFAVCIKVDAPDNLFVTRGHVLTHNTPMQLTWADNVVRHVNRPVLVLTPLAVGSQTVREAAKFGFDAEQSRDGRFSKPIAVTNYEKLHLFRPVDFGGVVLDEAQILKDFKGRTRSAITEFMRTIPYRLLCTATPAPNDYIELGTSAEALGEMGFQDMITRFFKQDEQRSYRVHAWGRVKYRMRAHGERDFWRWVCSWARACRKPSDLGFSDDGYELPPIVVREHEVRARTTRPGMLFALPAMTLPEQREERRRTIRERCERVAELVAHDRPAVAWCHLNDEGDLLRELIPDSVQVAGSDPDEAKEEAFEAFVRGDIRVMVTKPVIGALGLNWEHCAHQTFFPSHSYEQWHQGVHRSQRFGQRHQVEIDVVATEGEAGVLINLKRKSDQSDAMFARLVELMHEHLRIDRSNPFHAPEESPPWLCSTG